MLFFKQIKKYSDQKEEKWTESVLSLYGIYTILHIIKQAEIDNT